MSDELERALANDPGLRRCEEELRRVRAESLRRKRGLTLVRRNAAASELGDLLVRALAKLEDRENLHRQADEEDKELASPLAGKQPLEFADEDEPAWLPENVKRLVEAVEAGPRQPRAKSAAAIAEYERARRETTFSMLVQIARTGWAGAGLTRNSAS